jgi:hypothetical protein
MNTTDHPVYQNSFHNILKSESIFERKSKQSNVMGYQDKK